MVAKQSIDKIVLDPRSKWSVSAINCHYKNKLQLSIITEPQCGQVKSCYFWRLL